MNKTLQKIGAFSAFGMALCYLSLFIIYGAVLSFPQTDNVADKIDYVAQHYLLISFANVLGYLLFGCFLLIAVQAIYNRIQKSNSALLQTSSLFGFIWVVLMMCSGMIALVGIDKVIELHENQSEQAISLFYAYSTILNALGGGIELVGGLWVLLLSIFGLRENRFSKTFNLLGVWVGVLGVATIVQTIPELKDIFGLSQIFWFVGLGLVLGKNPN